jgi:hypothetical protein
MKVHNAGLDNGAKIFLIDRDDSLETVESKEHDVIGECAAGKSRSCSARDVCCAVRCERPHNVNDFITSAWKHRESRHAPISRQTVGVIDEKIGFPGHHEPASDDRFQLFSECSVAH